VRSLFSLAAVLSLLAFPTFAQDGGGLSTRNPLDEIKAELLTVLDEAMLPFTAEQERSITLVLEESRRASEQLFGDVMDFRDGPPQGERLDRARAGIAWMNDEFGRRVREYLTVEQRTIWDRYVEMRAEERQQPGGGAAGTSQQVQEMRINNNPFTPENQFWGWAGSGGSFGFASGGGVSTEIIQKGGAGAFHGSYEFRFRDETLNARNAFSSTKPPYQQRNFNLNTSGPVMRDRLTLGIGAEQNEEDNVETVNALTVAGPFQLGFTRPAISRNFHGNGTYQFSPRHSILFSINHGTNKQTQQGVGGQTLPERSFSSSGSFSGIDVRHVWFISDRLVQDVAFDAGIDNWKMTPDSPGLAVNVLGAFNGGGFQDRNERRTRNYNARALWIATRQKWAVRAGGYWNYSGSDEVSENNYLGTFEFADLEAFVAGTPAYYRVTRGNPNLKTSQQETASFIQAEYKASRTLTFFFGLRHEYQTNLRDYNNFDPRFSVAYALGNSTVVRAGVGVFHMRVENWIHRELQRLDGQQQYEILIENPSWPDPFQAGSLAAVPPPSRRVLAEDFAAPYSVNSALVVERSLPGNLLVTASLDYHRGIRGLRGRDLNAPLPGTPPGPDDTIPRPDPSQGVILQVESTGLSSWTAFRVSMRQRFSIFSVNADYNTQVEKDEGGGAFNSPTNNYNFRDDLSRTTEHHFNASVNARLPFGAYLTTEVDLSSGDHYSVTTGRDDNRDGVTNDRPAGERRDGRRGPYHRTVNFSVTKSLALGGSPDGESSRSLNVFANLSNAFNTVNLNNPVGVITSANFGKFLGASNPREIELGVRFQF
jgi:hypothetical protein